MSALTSLYWLVRCDGCGGPATAHAMSVLREAMLCLNCLKAESRTVAAQRRLRRVIERARGNRRGHPSEQ